MSPSDADDRQMILAAIQRLEAGTGRNEFAADQILEEMARVEASVDDDAARAALEAMAGGELERAGDGIYRVRGGGEPAPGASRSDPGIN